MLEVRFDHRPGHQPGTEDWCRVSEKQDLLPGETNRNWPMAQGY